MLIKNKYVYRKISLVILTILFFTLLLVPRQQPKATEKELALRILEIEPGNRFILGDANKSVTGNSDFAVDEIIDGSTIMPTLVGKNIGITHVTMQQFISETDMINGKYDIVVIGRFNEGLRKGYNNSTDLSKNNFIYGDYTNPLSETSKKIDLKEEGYIPEGFNWKNVKNGQLKLENKTYVEYYSENDITKKRGKEILSLIQSNQPVYIDNKIFDGSLNKTNLVNLFSSEINNTNCVKFETDNNGIVLEKDTCIKPLEENISLLKQIILDYNANKLNINKRPTLLVEGPSGDSSDTVGDIKNRKMKFKINLSDNVIIGEVLKINLYLDLSGDSIFSDKELYYQQDITITDENRNSNTITYNMSKDFIGYLDWKVEVVRSLKDASGNNIKDEDENNIEVKSYKTGNILLSPLENQEKEIEVLQIYPDRNNLDLSNNDQVKNLLKEVHGYDIKITKATVKEFNRLVDNNKRENERLDDNQSLLNGKYDMVIIGFYDMYNIRNEESDFSKDAVDEIKDFIRTGQSVMFTHDTMPITIQNQSPVWNGSKMLGQNFRDVCGQARYIDEFNTSEKDLYKEYKVTKDKNGFIQKSEYVERTIPHDEITSNNNYNTFSYGYATDVLTGSGNRAINGNSYYSSSNKVFKINSGLINEYPFRLGDINVATTHHQYYQLNLEDPDVVPWYNIKLNAQDGNNAWKNQYIDKYDSRNNYYTYSKGNITYSGTGHSSINGEEEIKFFINTMIKAERGANHAPEIICSIPKEHLTNEINKVVANEDYIFYLDATDLDKDLVYMHITLNNEELKEKNVEYQMLKEYDDYNKVYEIDTNVTSDKALKITIPKDELQIDSEIDVRVEAEDTQGAKSIKQYKIKAIQAPQIDINAELNDLTKVDADDNPISSEVHDNVINVTKDDVVKAQYSIVPKDFVYGEDSDYLLKKVAIIIDKDIKNINTDIIKNAIINSIFNNNNLIKQNDDYVKFNLITYGSSGRNNESIVIDSNSKDNNGVKIDYRNELQNSLISELKNETVPSASNLNYATQMAEEFFYEDDESSSNVIINISREDVNYTLDNDLEDRNYSVVTLGISDNQQINLDSSLSNWHQALGGLSKDYYVSLNVDSHNDVANSIMPKIADSLAPMKYKTYTAIDISLNFDLGDEIDLVNGLKRLEDESEDNMYTKALPNIKFLASKQDDGTLLYKGYFLDNNSNKYYLDFNIKPSESAKGECHFGERNNIRYKNAIGQVKENKIDKNPILKLNEITVNHGVYKQINGNSAEIYSVDEIKEMKFAHGSTITFASNINKLYTLTNLELNIDSDVVIDKKPKIYKVLSDGELEKIGEFSDEDNSQKFKYHNLDGNIYSDIVVLYSVKIKENTSKTFYTNTISAEDKRSSATIYSDNKDLPDLF